MRKQLARIFFAVCLASLTLAAHAEGGCPPGQYPQSGQGWQTCVPIPGVQTQQHAAPRVHWINHYQAIATDEDLGILGAATDRTTNQSAIADAMSDCTAKGGVNCKLEIALVNGCVAMALGVTTREVQTGETKADAEASAMDRCKRGNARCEVFYSACSLPTKL